MKILVADDDKEILEALSIYLTQEGYEVETAADGLEAAKILAQGGVSLAVLDVMMPGLDGIGVLEKLRKSSNIPVIILSAKDEEQDKICGLEAGADDYMTKPFSAPELLARIKSQLRRYNTLGGAEPTEGVYRTGGLVVDDVKKTVTVDGEPVRFTPVEFGILKLLTASAGRVFSIGEIYEQVWKEPAYSAENTVAVHVRRIREKIEINPKEPKYLKVVWGVGYKIEKY